MNTIFERNYLETSEEEWVGAIRLNILQYESLPLSIEKIDPLLGNFQSSCNNFFQFVYSIHFTDFHFKRPPSKGGNSYVEIVGRIITVLWHCW